MSRVDTLKITTAQPESRTSNTPTFSIYRIVIPLLWKLVIYGEIRMKTVDFVEIFLLDVKIKS